VNDDAPRPLEASPPPKLDPETLVLRAPPRPAVRFRRGLIIGAAGLGSACLGAVTWLALEPPSFRLAAADEKGEPLAKATPDALANAPATYGDVPRLGPPLPGDLGRPILEHQREVEQRLESSDGSPADLERDRARGAAEAERQRLLSAREAARTSGVIVQLGGRNAAAESPQPPGAQPGAQAALPHPGGGHASALRPAPSSWMLAAGTIVPASLVTGLNSDLPGMVVAQVTENVRDSTTGRFVLVPQGARLIGSYDNRVGFGQRRALLVWNRIIFPDGSSIDLDNAPATDAAGYSGVEDLVDFHTWRLLKGIALSTLLGIGTELSLGSGESDLVRAVREATQQSAARAGDKITARNLDVQPTLTVRPGWPLRAVIHKDLVLPPWRD
jgi:type IV secretion system protein VirB10